MSSVVHATFFGTLVTLVLFLTARWSSFSYFAMIAPLLLALPLLAAWTARGPTTIAALEPALDPDLELIDVRPA
jgi:hypothetical protein